MPSRLQIIASLLTLSSVSSAGAHFPFIVPDMDGVTAVLIMSESLEPDDAVEMSLLASAELVLRDRRSAWPIAAPRSDSKDASMRILLPGEGTRTLAGVIDLGVMERGAAPHVLVYHPKTIVGDALDPATDLDAEVAIEIVPVRTPAGAVLRLEFDGSPAAGAAIMVVRPGAKDVELTTDAEGHTPVLEPGRIGAWARRWVEENGERDGRAYTQVRHYATLVADLPGAPSGGGTAGTAPRAGGGAESPMAEVAAVARLPRAVASFGAVIHDGWLYVYGGHAGTRHDYSTATVSGRLSRARLEELLAGEHRWEELAGGPAVQGMNLAAHRDGIIRVGGMEPRNAPGEAADNHSLTDVAMFLAGEQRWISLPPLPEPRSSHDVVVAGDTLVVVGGWSMGGEGSTTIWPQDALLLDLGAARSGSADAEWRRVEQPFRRRALTAATVGTLVYCLGGFDEHDVPHTDVEVLDLETGSWSKAPALPGAARNGFAPAACVVGGRLHVSVASGGLFRLADDRSAWEPVAEATPRIVHRLVAHGDEVLILGGARGADMTDLIEAISPDGARRVPAAATVPVTRVGLAAESLADPEVFEESMAAIDEVFDALRRLDRGGWSASTGDPESDAAALAESLARHFREMPTEGPGVPASFKAMHLASVESATELARLASATPKDSAALTRQLASIRASCNECHRAFRP
jgi:hypothetical protein